jgi:hypothetical protein
VLLAGGDAASPSSALLYDPTSETWSPAASLVSARLCHTATLLPNGKAIVVGGAGDSVQDSAALYDPAANTWSAAGSLANARYEHTATLLLNGTVLVAGGFDGSSVFASAELYEPLAPTVQYSDELTLAAGGVPEGLLGAMQFAVDGSTAGLTGSPTYDSATGMGSQGYLAALPWGRYGVAAAFDGEDTPTVPAPVQITGVSPLLVLQEDATVTAAAGNPVSACATSPGGNSGAFSLGAVVSEDDDSSPGDLTKAGPVTCTLTPAGGGSSYAETGTVSAAGAASCAFSGIPVGEYGVVFTIASDNGYYTANPSAATTLTVEDPPPGPAVVLADRRVQYGDTVSLTATVTPPIPGVLAFRVNGSTSGLLSSASYNAGNGSGSQRYRALLPAGDYAIVASFTPEASEPVSAAATLTVTPEAMTVIPAPSNAASLAVPWVGQSSGAFTLRAAFAQERDGCYGAISGTPVTCILRHLQPAGSVGALASPPATPNGATYTRTVLLSGLPGPLPVMAAFSFSGIPTGSYGVRFLVADGRYEGQAEGAVLQITEPPLVFQKWVEPAASVYRIGSTVPVAFLLRYGVSTDQATLTVTGPRGVLKLDRRPCVYDVAAGQHRYPGGLVTTGWARGSYTLRIDLPNGSRQLKVITLR